MGNIIPFPPRHPPDRAEWLRTYRRFWDFSLNRLITHIALVQKEEKMGDLKIDAPANSPLIIITRTLKAPRALVWRALSEPAHVIRWWGPHAHSNQVLTFDFRVGGKWRFRTTTADGEVIIFHGEYREIAAPETLSQTFGIEGMFGGAYSLDTTTLEAQGAQTLYRITSTMPGVAARDGMLASGMETGLRQGLERLDAILEDFKANA